MKVAILSKARPELLSRIPPDLPHVVVEAGADGRYGAAELAKFADVEALLVSAEPVHDQLLDAAPRLRIVQRLGVGYNTLDLEACARRGIPCCNVAGVNKEAVAEHGLALILALSKQLREADALTREREWAKARLLTAQSFEVQGKTLGIVGLGDTGSSLALRARAFGMRIVFNDVREIPPALLAELEAEFMEKDDLFRSADVVSVNTDLNDATRGMVDARRLALMKPTALFICCARGHIVEEEALADALNRGALAGAGIDVFAEEPVPADNPLLKARNILVTSHVAGVNPETGLHTFHLALDNVRAVVERREKPNWVVNGVE